MKKYLVTILIVLSMLAMFAGTASAAANIEFLGGTWTGHGVNFKFNVSEKLPGVWITATVSWDGGSAKMTCNQEGDIVTCAGPKSAADKNITVTFQGISYSTYVNSHSYCYNVWDWWDFTNNEWTNFGPYCQESPANEGDIITYTVPDPAGSFESWAEFYTEVPDCAPPAPGYYYPSCPY